MKDIHVYYDVEGDLLETLIGPATPAIMQEIVDEIFQSVDSETGQIRGWTVLNFRKHGDVKELAALSSVSG